MAAPQDERRPGFPGARATQVARRDDAGDKNMILRRLRLRLLDLGSAASGPESNPNSVHPAVSGRANSAGRENAKPGCVCISVCTRLNNPPTGVRLSGSLIYCLPSPPHSPRRLPTTFKAPQPQGLSSGRAGSCWEVTAARRSLARPRLLPQAGFSGI